MTTMRNWLAVAFAWVAVVAVAACAGVAVPALVKPVQLQITSGKAAEECLSLESGERVEWRFESSVPVDFNLHFHRGREVVTPVDHPRTQNHSGAFAASVREEYCLMWKNAGGVPAFVTGEVRRLNR